MARASGTSADSTDPRYLQIGQRISLYVPHAQGFLTAPLRHGRLCSVDDSRASSEPSEAAPKNFGSLCVFFVGSQRTYDAHRRLVRMQRSGGGDLDAAIRAKSVESQQNHADFLTMVAL